jgi:indole-3-glycerol phosphate synthase
MNVIAEVKKASPSGGNLDSGTEPSVVAQTYRRAGAAAISVLTEPHYFAGSLSDLQQVHQAVDVPVLRKDFIVDEYQIYEAKAYGADAILLIARVLDASLISDLFDVALDLDLDVLIELYDESEIAKLDLDRVKIVGANNRDLSTMTVDIKRSVKILGRLPDTVTKVSESGVKTLDELKTLIDNRIHAALIGESLMKAPNPGQYLKDLLSVNIAVAK